MWPQPTLVTDSTPAEHNSDGPFFPENFKTINDLLQEPPSRDCKTINDLLREPPSRDSPSPQCQAFTTESAFFFFHSGLSASFLVIHVESSIWARSLRFANERNGNNADRKKLVVLDNYWSV